MKAGIEGEEVLCIGEEILELAGIEGGGSIVYKVGSI